MIQHDTCYITSKHNSKLFFCHGRVRKTVLLVSVWRKLDRCLPAVPNRQKRLCPGWKGKERERGREGV